MEKNNSALFYTCSLIEFIGRETKNKRSDVIDYLGQKEVARILKYADVFHCEPIVKVADDFVEKDEIPEGNFDNVSSCKYNVPDYWDIGEVFERLIEDCYDEDRIVEGIFEVYHSWIAERILNFNSDLYYQSREYISLCYKEGDIISS